MELDGGKGWAVERSVEKMLEGTLSDTIRSDVSRTASVGSDSE